ncbi:NF038122 family metalloprotease [Bradyrhizobium sp. SZCCHNR1098]|uniref:NF038122 family metalloprotease n=1 Tax=Bradyrhizobium sp. SZCCHNR1098 TaxID=3057370 RepID=UPI0029167A4D|nr:NF038122 family metalloprotease [Bradyrhizobium sp. SZCCHNR1098]
MPALLQGSPNTDPIDEGVGPPPSNPVELPEEAVESLLAQGDFAGIGAVTAVSAGGLTINLLFDTAAMNAPASFRAGIQQAAAILTSMISDRITVNIKIDYSGVGGGAAAGPDGGQWMSYSSVRSNLINYASPGDTTFNALPAGSSIQGQSYVAVWNSQLKLWGGLGANDATTDDGSATFATDINSNLLVGVALHELTHAFGRVPYGPQPDVFDLFRFSSPGVRLMTGGATAGTAYFSLDGGYTKLADYGQSSDPSDFLNSGVQGGNDPFNEFYTYSTLQTLTAVDLKQMDALGFHVSGSSGTVIQTNGDTSLTLLGGRYYLINRATGTGPEMKYGGTPVTVGEFGNVAPIGAVQTSSGYNIAWQVAGANQLTFTTADHNGNYTSNICGVVSGNSLTSELQETTFGQDFNRDGTVGVTASLVHANGNTNLLEIADEYFMYVNGSGPAIKIGGAPVVVGQLGNAAPIGAIQTPSGYNIVWKDSSTGQFTFTAADSNGNYTSNLSGWVSGASATAESEEVIFGQDFNGDGTIGPMITVIQVDGSTSLVQIGNSYGLYTSGSGPTIKIGGTPVVVGQLGNTTPIGAILVGSGYDIAWKDPTTGQFTFTAADSNGNYTSNLSGWVSGTSATAKTFETTFHQDFNGDGVIGMSAPIVIQTDGSTSLVQIDNSYGLYTGGSGPTIKISGAPVIMGQLGNTIPIGAIQIGSGYDIAWKDPTTGQFTFTTADSDGNYTANLSGWISGTSTTAENLETVFHQDFNGDGTIGIPSSGSPLIASPQSATPEANYSLKVSTDFSGNLIGFGGTAAQIDLKSIAFTSLQMHFDETSGMLSLSDGANSASLHFVGPLSQDNFHFATDGQDGTLISGTLISGVAASAGGTASQSVSLQGHDTFVFAEHFGQVSISDFAVGTDKIAFSQSIFADPSALQAAIHDDAAGNAVITDAVLDTITIQHVSTAELLSHLSSFHLV